jgi:hypothetical protein
LERLIFEIFKKVWFLCIPLIFVKLLFIILLTNGWWFFLGEFVSSDVESLGSFPGDPEIRNLEGSDPLSLEKDKCSFFFKYLSDESIV